MRSVDEQRFDRVPLKAPLAADVTHGDPLPINRQHLAITAVDRHGPTGDPAQEVAGVGFSPIDVHTPNPNRSPHMICWKPAWCECPNCGPLISTATTLRQAAALMREEHGPDHKRHEMWSTIADLLDEVAKDCEYDDSPAYLRRANAVANAYLGAAR